MINKIDHLVIITPDPQQTAKEIEEAFGLVAPPIIDFGIFASAMFTFGNVNIEVLKLGEQKDFKPYLYGIAFEPTKASWDLLKDLNQKNIEHALPIKQTTEMISWTNTMLKGLLDNVIPSNYDMHTDNRFNRGLSKTFTKLMGSNFVVKALMKDVGESMIFFCEYDKRIKDYTDYSQKIFTAFNGGKYTLKGVENVVIEKTESNTTWEALGNPSNEKSAQFQFINSDKNRLNHIILTAEKTYDNKEIMIGDVRFVIR